MVFYLGSDKPLPLIKPQNWGAVDTSKIGWQSEVVPFSVESLDETNRSVAEKFDLSEVRYAGAFEGCGCGFGVCVLDDDCAEPPDEHEMAGRISRRHLHDYIIENGVTALYCCWTGDEDKPVSRFEDLDPKLLLDFHFGFEMRCFYTIRGNGKPFHGSPV